MTIALLPLKWREICNIKGPKVVFKSACIVTMVAFVKKRFFVSTYGSSNSAFVVALMTFEKKKFFVSPQVPLKTISLKYVFTLAAFEEEKRFL